MNTKISVIVPCYNCSEHIGYCLDSIINQTIGINALELICVDDCSTDDTLDVLSEYEKKYSDQLLLVKCDENGKQGRARNIGLQYATGDYVMFVDADDWIAPTMAEILLSKCIECDCDFAQCGFQVVQDRNSYEQICKQPFKQNFEQVCNKMPEQDMDEGQLIHITSEQERNDFFVSNGFLTSVWRRVYKKSFIEKHHIIFPENIFMEDIFFSQLCLLHCNTCYIFNQPLYFYYQRQESTMNNSNLAKHYMDIYYVSKMVLDYCVDCDCFYQMKQALGYVYVKKAFYDISLYMIQLDIFPKDNFQIIRDSVQHYFPDLRGNVYLQTLEDVKTHDYILRILGM